MHEPVSPFFAGSRFLFVFPHPDDEVFSCIALMRRLRAEQPDATIDALWIAPLPAPAAISRRPGGYAAYGALLAHNFAQVRTQLRVTLLDATLAFAGRSRMVHLESESIHAQLEAVVRAGRYSDILTCPIEGGHPDHDVTCAVTAAVVRDAEHPVRATEYALYHGGTSGRFTSGSFLDDTDADVLALGLSVDDVRLKELLRDAYSAEPSLASFELGRERFRRVVGPPTLAAYARPVLHFETCDSRVGRSDVMACLASWGCM